MDNYQNMKQVSQVPSVRQYKGMIEEIHKEIELLENNLLPVRNQVPRAEKDAKGFGVELLGELNSVIQRLRTLNEEVKF